MGPCKACLTHGANAMTPTALAGLIPALFGLIAAQPGAVQQSVTRMIAQDEVILRVSVQPRPPLRRIIWIARKGPKCIRVGAIRGALLSSSGEVDLILRNRARIRAKFDRNCPALDFYNDFYLQLEDARLCARRDAVHSRMGGSCMIDSFQLLEPRIKD